MSILLPITFQHYTRCQDFQHYYPLPRFSTLLPSTGIFYIITLYRDFLHYNPLPGIWTLLPVQRFSTLYYLLQGFSTLLPASDIFNIITRTKILGCDFRSTFDPLNINLYNYFCINFILNIIPTEHWICSLIPNPAYWTTIITLNQNAIELKSTTPNASRSNYSRMC